jgi:hypothetical protein
VTASASRRATTEPMTGCSTDRQTFRQTHGYGRVYTLHVGQYVKVMNHSVEVGRGIITGGFIPEGAIAATARVVAADGHEWFAHPNCLVPIR